LRFRSDPLRCEVVLDQFSTTVRPAIRFTMLKNLFSPEVLRAALSAERAVNDDHRFTEQRGLHRGGAAGDDRKSAAARALYVLP